MEIPARPKSTSLVLTNLLADSDGDDEGSMMEEG
jgi:hypothetical protein